MIAARTARTSLRLPAVGCWALVALLLTHPAWGQEAASEAQEIDFEVLAEISIELATGNPKPIFDAPAVASVITAEQIETMGARDLSEVLETIPGLHVMPSRDRGLDPIYAIRGVQSATNAQVLILVDGVPITQALTGGRVLGFRLPVTSIARIEVIRGPGSAVYGADAFAGVINVVTRTAADTEGPEVGLRLGSFDSGEAWVRHGTRRAGWDLAFSLDWMRSGGDDEGVVERDLQTELDGVFGTGASLAPGPLDTRFEVFDAHLSAERGGWGLRLWGWRTEDRGIGPGAAQALDPAGRQDATLALADLSYRAELADDWELSTRLSYLYLDQSTHFTLFPPGAVLPIGGDGNVDFAAPAGLVLFPEGLIAEPGDTERTAVVEAVALYSGLRGHLLRLSAGRGRQEVATRERKNYGPGVIDGTEGIVDGTLTDVTGSEYVYMPDQERNHWFLSLQDEWTLARAWALTAGVRYDRYSDFGGTVNPRLALVWAASYRLTAKLLYGSAFRAPSLGQQFTINNPVRLGNPDLDPETIDTLELVFDYHPGRKLRTVVSLFAYEIEGLIDQVPDPGATTRTEQNAHDQDGYGCELEASWQLTPALQLAGNFAWQHSEDEDTGARVPDVPGRQLHLTARWQPRPVWSLYAQLAWIGDRNRAAGDGRPPIDDYALLDLTLRRRRIGKHWDLALGVRNLLDDDVREPSGGEIPFDYPLARRSFYVELRHHHR